MRTVLLAVVICTASGCASAPAARSGGTETGFPVGVAAVDITPPEPIRLTGYGNRVEPTAVISQHLWAKALAFGANDQRPSVLITTDLIGIPRHVTDEIARRLRAASIERAQLAVTATHTHTGPSLAGMLPHIFSSPITPEQQAVIDRYTRGLTDKLEQVALAALADRRSARLTWGRGTARFAANRRVLKDGKWVAFGVNPKGPVDHDLSVLAVRGPDGALRAVLLNYACHATTLEGRDNFVHGDWPGSAQAAIQQRYPGAVAMVAVGAGADANPNPRGHGLPDVERHALEIATEVERLLGSSGARPDASVMRTISSPPAGRYRDLDVAFSRLPMRQEWEAQASRKDASGYYARAVLQRLDRREPLSPTAPYPVQTWTFGADLAMVFLGGEVVSDYALRLKRELDGTRLWVNAYSNDVPFYVASRRMIPEGGYEVDRSMVYYGMPARLADGTEDQIIDAVRQSLLPTFARR